jgi:hypothetical protein
MYDKTCSQRLDEWAPQATPRPPTTLCALLLFPAGALSDALTVSAQTATVQKPPCLGGSARIYGSPCGRRKRRPYHSGTHAMQPQFKNLRASAALRAYMDHPAGAASDAPTTAAHTPCNHSSKNLRASAALRAYELFWGAASDAHSFSACNISNP